MTEGKGEIENRLRREREGKCQRIWQRRKAGKASNSDVPTLNLTLRGAEEEEPLVVRSCTWPAFAAALGSAL